MLDCSKWYFRKWTITLQFNAKTNKQNKDKKKHKKKHKKSHKKNTKKPTHSKRNTVGTVPKVTYRYP